MMNRRPPRIAITLTALACLALVPAGGAQAAGAPTTESQPPRSTLVIVEESALAAAEATTGWCVRGATFAVLFSAAFSLPAMLTGVGAPYSAARAGGAALAGCGIAVTWRSAARGVAYVDSLINPPPPLPSAPLPTRAPPAGRPLLIHTSG